MQPNWIASTNMNWSAIEADDRLFESLMCWIMEFIVNRKWLEMDFH